MRVDAGPVSYHPVSRSEYASPGLQCGTRLGTVQCIYHPSLPPSPGIVFAGRDKLCFLVSLTEVLFCIADPFFVSFACLGNMNYVSLFTDSRTYLHKYCNLLNTSDTTVEIHLVLKLPNSSIS